MSASESAVLNNFAHLFKQHRSCSVVHVSWISPLPCPLPNAGKNILVPVMLCLAGSHPSSLSSSLLMSVAQADSAGSANVLTDAIADAGLLFDHGCLSMAGLNHNELLECSSDEKMVRGKGTTRTTR